MKMEVDDVNRILIVEDEEAINQYSDNCGTFSLEENKQFSANHC